MKKIGVLMLSLMVLNVFSQEKKPKLVVGIIVDQMRMEYLYRFTNDFGNDGFKRLMNEGYTFHNMQFNYMPTYTAPGHSSVYTGTTPKMHGIVGNEYFNRSLGEKMYCTDDASVSLIGEGIDKEGKMSPKNLLSTTITDELKLATNFKGKVIGISIKDRSSILPAGHFADWAFWWSKKGNFISSTFYGDDLPQWAHKFNQKKHWKKYLDEGWHLLKDEKEYNESLADDNPYEGKLNYRIPSIFPYDFTEEVKNHGPDVIKLTPFGNDLLVDFARQAIENEGLGEDEVTDFLALSFSSTDYVGHVQGPRSMELQDTYLRLDLTLAAFLKYLDRQIGKGNYLLFLTADHACAENPNFLHDHKYEVRNLDYKEFRTQLKTFSTENFGQDFILSYTNQNVHLDEEAIKAAGLEIDDVVDSMVDYIQKIEFVKRAYSQEDVLEGNLHDDQLERIARGYDPKQNGQIVVLYQPGFMDYGYTGTTHGSSYGYDTHVPGIFFGQGISSGASHEKRFITQIAPSIAQLLGITFPNASEAEILPELFTFKK